ncbi:bifunctional RNase H/acid phosphatase [Streptomyces neyagawaensis]|uniref:bifunctional RNase H/acid phosphatase n=3 Tax=Streptomyces neyagawaensis TaxID=42238 RepID=UPI00201D195D|nr:bifunctional RNase H/acid phosphatase [Streptomyces neyagawaensis]MCL6732696.1 bifunctional RNase H/acid phosphatase [Streptomyces neyagawaensis]MDE1681534.1 bifunctional RNase H/acid phosphatase [Streptomyces neyagawaensis]
MVREFIVEADGGSRGNPGPAGYGSVVLDGATGEPLVEAAEYIGVATNNVAEYRGLIAGLKAAYALDPAATVRVRMDSKLVVEQMSGRWKIKHPDMKPLAAEAQRVYAPGHVTYEWIPRDQNKHADRLANEAMDAGKRGEQWSPSMSTADLDTRATRQGAGAAASAAVPEPSGPPGDAAAGAARARAALAGARGGAGNDQGDEGGTGPRTTAAEPSRRAVEPFRRAVEPSTGAAAETPAGAAAETPAGAAVEPPAGAAVGASAAAAASAGAVADVSAGGAAEPPGGAVSDASAGRKAAADIRAARNVASTAPDLGTPATFVLLRHGETALTPQKRFSGSGGSDPSLSDVGRYQAERVAAALAARGTIQEVVSSPLARCRETAEIVAARLGLGVTLDDGLRETDFGAWEGLTFGEVRERYPDDMNAWLASPDAEPTGGGESFEAVAQRVAATRDRLTEAHRGRTVLLVSHVTPIKTLVRLALGAPPESLFRMELSAASLTALAYYADGNATLRLLNDTSHLR